LEKRDLPAIRVFRKNFNSPLCAEFSAPTREEKGQAEAQKTTTSYRATREVTGVMVSQGTLPRKARIPSRREITHLQRAGRKIHTKHFVICFESTYAPCSRLAVTVSKKVDKRAVQRNRIKRLLKEGFRLLRGNLTQTLDVVIIARKNAVECSFRDCMTELSGAFQQRGLLLTSPANEKPKKSKLG